MTAARELGLRLVRVCWSDSTCAKQRFNSGSGCPAPLGGFELPPSCYWCCIVQRIVELLTIMTIF
jgi:hypothetical protein